MKNEHLCPATVMEIPREGSSHEILRRCTDIGDGAEEGIRPSCMISVLKVWSGEGVMCVEEWEWGGDRGNKTSHEPLYGMTLHLLVIFSSSFLFYGW